MPSDLLRIAEAVITSIQPGTPTDESLHKLQGVFQEDLIVAAFDLIDRESVIKYVTPWGRTHYEVHGSTKTYTVFPNLAPSPTPFYCSCPAFSFAVLMSETHLMCKHILATRLAQQMALCVERNATQDDIVALVTRQFS